MARTSADDGQRDGGWTLRKKVLLGYGIVLLLAGVAFGWALVNLLRLGDASGAILSENYRSIIAADYMIDALERQDSGVLLYILGFEDEGVRQFRENQSEFSQWLARAEDNVTIPGEAVVLRSIDSSYTEYLVAFTRSLRGNGADGPLRMRYHEELLPSFRAVRESVSALRLLKEETMAAASDRAGRVARTATWSVTFVGVLTLLFGLAFSLVLTNRLVRPIRRMREAAEHIAVTQGTDAEDEGAEPVASSLSVYPNPTSASATVALTLDAASEARVSVYDVLGRRVALLSEGLLEAGMHRFHLDGSGLPAGVYLVRAEGGSRSFTERITLMR